jgi:DtxR family Mn-dependent transcriptional regulator
MRAKLSQATQDYLKTIYKLSGAHGRATTSQLADDLGVKPASVTGMLQKLAKASPSLVDYTKHYGVVLTAAGRVAALEIVRHHRLIELFLHERLEFPWDEVHEEAERLEHAISEKMERRIADLLGDPVRDPHGQVIPSPDLELSPTSEVSLDKLRPPQRALVQRVQDDDPSLLRYVERIGLLPSARLTVLEYRPYDGNLEIQIDGEEAPIVLGPRVTSQVYVDIQDAEREIVESRRMTESD